MLHPSLHIFLFLLLYYLFISSAIDLEAKASNDTEASNERAPAEHRTIAAFALSSLFVFLIFLAAYLIIRKIRKGRRII
jgi:Ca2+/Na+ antiporter